MIYRLFYFFFEEKMIICWKENRGFPNYFAARNAFFLHVTNLPLNIESAL